MELVLYLNNGNTLKFEQVTNLFIDGEEISFNYVSSSTGKHKEATFKFASILGMATEK